MRQRSLRRPIALAFLGLALFSGAFGALLAVLFAYTIEDHLFDRLVALEVEQVQAATQGSLPPTPALPFTTYYSEAELPDFLRLTLEDEPKRKEIFGDDGRHYHVRRVENSAGETIWAVLQVEELLAVRPAISWITVVLVESMLTLTLVAASIGLLLAHRVTRPLRMLAEEVTQAEPDALPTEGNAHYPPDEVGRLAETLREAFGRIQAFIKREQQFTQDASHELRTPLAVIESSGTLLSRTSDPAQVEALIDRIRTAALSMHLSVDVLLALARERTTPDRQESFSVLPIIERTVVNHADLLEGKPVDVDVAVGAEWRVDGDPAALQVLIANLVSNAFRYTETGTIRIERAGDDLLITDSGMGIDPDLAPEITRPEVKGHASSGLGLGLSIVERLCEHCGWEFELSSSPNGTTARLGLG
jgi:signal transduction histidine kinase